MNERCVMKDLRQIKSSFNEELRQLFQRSTLTQIDQFFKDEYQSYIACEMLSEITAYSATEYFNELAQELAEFLGISPLEAAENYLLPVTTRILDGARKAASPFGHKEKCNAAG